MKNIIEIKNNDLYEIIKESVNNVLKEEMQPDKKYTHYLIRKSDNKILNGWDYTGYDTEDIKYYTKIDIADMDINPKDVKILSKRFLEKSGINPQDWGNWSN